MVKRVKARLPSAAALSENLNRTRAQIWLYFALRLVVVAALLLACDALFSANDTVLALKPNFSSAKPTLCLGDVVAAQNISARDADKLSRSCSIDFKGVRLRLTAKDIELYAWAAGIIPKKITGSQIVVTKSANAEPETKTATASATKVRRGSAVRLKLQSTNMSVVREAVTLADAFPGETVDVRPQGTRKNLRAKLVDAQTAEMQ